MACEAQFPPSTKEIAGGGYEKPASLVGIPPELVLKILSMLDVGDLVRCLQVCMHLNGIVSGSATLHYRLALVRCGMQDGHPACYMGTSSRIYRLVEYQRCWDTLSWRERITMNLGFEAYRRPKRYVKLFSRHVVLTHFESPLFTLVRLPSGLRNIPALSMKTSVPEVGSGTSAVDVQQNLLISVNQMPGDPSKWRICALTMHSGELHPKAQPRYSLVVEVAALDDVPAIVQHMRIHIQGMHAALQVHNVGVIWDWRTNQLTMNTLTDIRALRLLPRDWVATVRLLKPEDFTSPAVLHVFRIDGSVEMTLGLPLLSSGSEFHRADIYCNTPPDPVMNATPFRAMNDASIFVVSYNVQPRQGAWREFVHIVDFAGLQTLALDEEGNAFEHASLWVEWEAWAMHSRVFQGATMGSNLCRSRFCWETPELRDSRWYATVCDFHPVRVKVARQKEREGRLGEASRVVDGTASASERLKLGVWFGEPNELREATLPYVETRVSLPRDLRESSELRVGLVEDGMSILEFPRVAGMPPMLHALVF